MYMRFVLVFLCVVFASSSLRAEDNYPLSVQTVYGLIGKVHMDYNPEKSKLTPAEAEYLDELFQITDEAVRARYFMMNAFKMEDHRVHYKEKYAKTIEMLMAALSDINAPTNTLKQVEKNITEAMFAQYSFFTNLTKKYKEQGGAIVNWRAEFTKEDVKTSHQKLIKAYDLLKNEYGQEEEKNYKAFYESLCALDFI
jgi:DhnA family fructose-bisphosphate aldolase class Ia